MMVEHFRGIIYGRTQKAVLYLRGCFSATTFKKNRTHISLARLASVQACLSLTWSEISRLISDFFVGHIVYEPRSSCSELTYLYPGIYLIYKGLFESYLVGNKQA